MRSSIHLPTLDSRPFRRHAPPVQWRLLAALPDCSLPPGGLMRAQPETGQAWRNAAPHSPLERFPSYASYRFALPGKPPACGAARLLRRLRQARACRGRGMWHRTVQAECRISPAYSKHTKIVMSEIQSHPRHISHTLLRSIRPVPLLNRLAPFPLNCPTNRSALLASNVVSTPTATNSAPASR